MKNERRLLALIIILISLFNRLSAEEKWFFSDLDRTQKTVLANAYQTAGESLSEIDPVKGKRFIQMAESIRSSPDTETEPTLPDISNNHQASLRYSFNKMINALFSERKEVLENSLNTRVYLPGYDDSLPAEVLLKKAELFSEKYKLTHYTPHEFYDMESIVLTELPAGFWQLSVSCPGAELYPVPEIPIWKPVQNFYFFPNGKTWILTAAGN